MAKTAPPTADALPDPLGDDLIAFVKSLNTNGRSQNLIAEELRDLLKRHRPDLTDEHFKAE